LKLLEPRRPFLLVETQAELSQAIAGLATEDVLAVDAERASGFRYSQQAYLVQFATSYDIFLIDPTCFTSVEIKSLADVVSKKTWLLHSATQDLPCLAELGIFPSSIFDTELAARICGAERFGLSSLALELLDFEMAKEHSAADWSIRPLTPEMLTYAALDVDVMHELYESLRERLIELERSDWAQQEFEKLLSFRPKPQPKDAWRNLPGISKVKDRRRLQIAAGLYAARDRIARSTDVAPGRLIPDRSIMAAATQLPTSKKDLAGNREFQGRASRSMLNEWWQAIEASVSIEITDAELDPNHIPNHRSWEKRFPEAHLRLQNTRPLIAEKATELGLAPEILLSPDTLRRICFEPASEVINQLVELGARPWQIQLVAEPIQRGLALGNQ
jgi:ribonuclease D